MEITSAKFEVKSIDNTGEFTGFAAVFGNEDLGGDLIESGAFSKTLIEKNGETPILWMHKMDQIVGIGRLRETPQGLEVKGKLVLDSNPTAQQAYSLLKAGAVRGLSIGYDVVRHAIQGGCRHLKELKLYEVSLTAFPMNTMAQVTAVKSEAIDAELCAINELRRMLRKA